LEEIAFKDRLPLDPTRVKTFRDLVVQAVESQLLSDVPVGATVSGGLDSSIIASVIALLGKKKFPVFTAQFPGSKFDESCYITALHKKWAGSFELIFTPVEELDLEQSMEQTLLEQEEPFGDPSIIAHGFLVRAAHQNKIPVLLGGQGGDEVSMGYPWMYHRLISYALQNYQVSPVIDYIKSSSSLNTTARILLSAVAPGVESKLRAKSRFNQKSFLQQSFQNELPVDTLGSNRNFQDIYRESLYTVGLPHLCHYDDRSTMAKSIEGRMPFLDHRLFEFASMLQVDAFYKNGYSKVLLRKAFRNELPQEITERKDKIGFYTPLQQTLKKSKKWILNTFAADRFLDELVTSEFKANMLRTLQNDTVTMGDSRCIFRLLSLALWHRSIQKN
jgi:asparagine synthase (glutamine-hydrolysing)